MTLTITQAQIDSEQDAIDRLKSMGYYTLTAKVPPANNEFHWHDFDTTFFIIDGEFRARCEGDDDYRAAGFGAQVDAPRGVVHREQHDGYRAVFGWPIDPATLTMPLERDPPFPGG
jgi:hypothetical protein